MSYVVPTMHSMFSIRAAEGVYPHHPSFAAAAGTDTAHDEAIIVGKGLALTGWEMLVDTGLLQQAREQWKYEIESDK